MDETGKTKQSRYEKSAPSGVSENDTLTNSDYRSQWEKPSNVPPVVLTTILMLVAALMLVGVSVWVWEYLTPSPLLIVLNVFLGMLLSLPVLISLWMSLGGQHWIIRIPLSTMCLLSLSGVFLTTLGILSGSVDNAEIWIIGAIILAVALAIQIPAWTVRLWYGVSISRQSSESAASKQFTIKQLLITTTVLAFLVPLLQWVAAFKIFNDSGPPMDEILRFCGVFIVVLVFLTLLSVLVVFSSKLRVASFCILLVGLATIPFVVVPSLKYISGLEFSVADSYLMDKEKLLNVFAFISSNAVTMIVVLSLYFALGFRLRSSRR